MDRTCLDYSAYLPASAEELTEFGICLNDGVFEPFIEELLEGSISTSCQPLVERKKFVGDRPACPDFQESECIEIDDSSPLGRELRRLAERGELTPEALEALLLEERLREIDWKTVAVDPYAVKLQSKDPEERNAAISSLGGLIAFGNPAAFQLLLQFLAGFPPARTTGEVYLKMEILRHLSCSRDNAAIAPYLIDALYRTPSNNTTRQWISAIFEFLGRCPFDVIQEPLANMLSDKRFSPRFRKKVKETLSLSLSLLAQKNRCPPPTVG